MDCLISGDWIASGSNYNDEWFDILSDLFSTYSSMNKNKMDKYHPYIYSTFQSFVEAKKQLTFRMQECVRRADQNVMDMIMHRLIKTDINDDKCVASQETS